MPPFDRAAADGPLDSLDGARFFASDRLPPMTSTVAKAWEAIEAVLDDETRRSLRRPASAAQLAKAASVLGPLPASLRALLACHDGMREPLHLNVRLLSTSEITKTWRMRMRSSKTDEYHWSPSWIPFTDADGDHLCLDAKTGRVLEFHNAGPRPSSVAPSLLAWLGRAPRLVRAEQRQNRRRAAMLPPAPERGTKRERERLARLDGQLHFFAGWVGDLEREWKGPAPEERVFDYSASPLRVRDVVARSLEVGHLVKVTGGYRLTPKGRRIRRA